MKLNDFFKPRWKHSDPKIRYEAIKELVPEYNLKDLIAIVQSDDSNENRKLALKKIADEGALVSIAETAEDKSTREAAQKKLNEIWTKRLKGQKNEVETLKLLDRITDPKCLENIALTDKNRKVREACLNKLTNSNAIYKVALKENETELALRAFEKLDKPVQFETLAKNANNKTVRIRAKEKVSANGEVAAQPSDHHIQSAKLELLCVSVEGHLGTLEWEESAKAVRDAEETWKNLGSNEALTSQRFEKAVKEFWNHYNEHLAREKKRDREKADFNNHMKSKEAICDSFDKLLLSKKTDENIAEMEGLIQAWQQIRGDYPEAQPLNHRYQAALASYRRDFKAEAEARQKVAKIEEILGKVDRLSTQNAPGRMEESLKKIQSQWEGLGVEDDSEWQSHFKAKVVVVEEAIQLARDNLKENQEKVLKDLKALASKIEKLVDDPDLISSEKNFREWSHTWKSTDPGKDIHPSLQEEYDTVSSAYLNASQKYLEAQEWLRWANLQKKQDICDQIQAALDNNTEPKALFKRLRELQGDWKAIGPVSWESSKDIWDTYRKLLDEVYERCKDEILELEKERQENLERKKTLCEKVESLSQADNKADNWKSASEEVKNAQSEWKNIGPVPREESDGVWERFRGACDEFFNNRRDYFGGLGQDKDENLEAKIKLCEWVESHQNSTEWKETAEIIKKAQEDWKSVGPVPKEKIEEIWNRFRTACDTFFHARDEHFKEFSANKAENLEKKESLCTKVEGLDQLENDEERFELIKQAQAEWKTIGPVDREKMEPLWERFRKPIDSFFETRKEKFEEEKGKREENLKSKEKLCSQAEEIAESTNWKETSEKLKSLQGEWKEIGPAPRKQDQEVWVRFRSACDTFFGRMKDHYKQLDEQRELNLRAKEDLCYQAESLAGTAKSEAPEDGAEGAPVSAEANNVNSAELLGKIKELQRKWKQTGPVHRSKSDELWARFRAACDYVYGLANTNGESGEIDYAANLAAKEELCEQAERIANQVHTDAQIMKIKDLQREWKNVGPVEPAQHRKLWSRFKTACDEVFSQDVRLQD